MSPPHGTPRRRAPGWWYPWIFVGGMAMVVLVNGAMIALAVETFSGLDTDDYYRKGIHYNEAIDGAQAQARLGWRADMALGGAGAGTVRVRMTDAAGRALDGLDLIVDAIRPTAAGHDRRVLLQGKGDGLYEGRLALPLPGQWDLRVLAYRGAVSFQQTRRVQAP